jgi:hypothetical protein
MCSFPLQIIRREQVPRQGHARSPSICHLDAPEKMCSQWVAALGRIIFAQIFDSQIAQKFAGVADLHPVPEYRHLDIILIVIVAMAKSCFFPAYRQAGRQFFCTLGALSVVASMC